MDPSMGTLLGLDLGGWVVQLEAVLRCDSGRGSEGRVVAGAMVVL